MVLPAHQKPDDPRPRYIEMHLQPGSAQEVGQGHSGVVASLFQCQKQLFYLFITNHIPTLCSFLGEMEDVLCVSSLSLDITEKNPIEDSIYCVFDPAT